MIIKKCTIIYLLLATGVFLMLTNRCKKDDDSDDNKPLVQIPIITTNAVSNITQTTAICGGAVTSDGGAFITSHGVCWSNNNTPTISDNKTMDGEGSSTFTSNITGLTAETTYYIRAYATNSAGTGYGNTLSFTTKEINTGTVTDIDGNVYTTIKIGDQWWMTENLKVTHYRNADPIPNVINNTDWSSLTTGAYCNYNNETYLAPIYGRLYNWFAVNDSRNIAPIGWHVASYEEWGQLINYLGGTSVAGGKLKETGVSHWAWPNTGATNEVGFTALPGGCRSIDGNFYKTLMYDGLFWTSTENGTDYAAALSMNYQYADIYGGNDHIKLRGYSIRCIKD